MCIRGVPSLAQAVAKCLDVSGRNPSNVARSINSGTMCDVRQAAMAIVATLCAISAAFPRGRNAVGGCWTKSVVHDVAKYAPNEKEK
jgi:hypothetical protein